MKDIALKFIVFYQEKISVLTKRSCVFYPTCSEYTKQAIEKYGLLKGLGLGFIRVLRCHPWQKNHIDKLK